MEIKDLSWNESITKRFNNPLLPRSIRGIIVGKDLITLFYREVSEE